MRRGRTGDPRKTRTSGLRFRKPPLYPAELWGRLFIQWFTERILTFSPFRSSAQAVSFESRQQSGNQDERIVRPPRGWCDGHLSDPAFVKAEGEIVEDDASERRAD